MRKNITIIIIILFNGSRVFSQKNVLPGGVEKPQFWIQSKNNGESYYWKNNLENDLEFSNKMQKGTSFNFNPSIIFDSTEDPIIFPLGTATKCQQTLFMVYKVKDSLKEHILWTINDTKKTISVATTQRLADLKKYSYQSYQDKLQVRKANIHFFQQNYTDNVAKPSLLTVGTKPEFENLPPEEFNGALSEIVLYNRVLSGSETQKVASYLAMKYGISLAQFDTKNYISSNGKTVWNTKDHKDFDASITAIGRDDGSGLLQTKSSNMFMEGLLTLELKSKAHAIPNNYFVFWSDNGKNLFVKKQEQGEPLGIDRQWQLDFPSAEDLKLDWTLDPKFIKGTLPKDSYYWLLVDYSGEGTYKETNSEYINLGSTVSSDKLVLNQFNWDKLKSGTAKFTIKIAPEMFSRVWITESQCDVPNSGGMQYSIVGGEAPYTITVKNAGSSTVLKQWVQTSKSSTVVQLSSGNYDYIVHDAKGNLYSETIFVADKEGTFPNLNSDYLLTDGNALVLDASLGLPSESYKYEWLYEGNFSEDAAKISIDQPGTYEIRLTNTQGCKTTTKIQVETDGKMANSVNVMLLYPNPTADGRFSVAMQFPKKTNATIRVYTATGTLIKAQQFPQIESYIHNDMLQVPAGMYLVTVNSDFGTKTFKVIVK